MIRVLALRPAKAYAPEVEALGRYLGERPGFEIDTVDRLPDAADLGRYHLLYRMMGFAPRWQPTPVPELHDYASVSTGTAARTKNALKRLLTRRPALRSFLSPWVERQMGFTDGVRCFQRDMGVPDAFLEAGRARAADPVAHDFDLLMVGSITASRGLPDLLERLRARPELRIALVGDPDPEIRAAHDRANVHFIGRLAHHDIPEIAARSAAGLNWMPPSYPFHHQTSTKVLEYFALGLPVVSNPYPWIDEFVAARGATYVTLEEVLADHPASLEAIRGAGPVDVTDLAWSSVWARSGIARHIEAVTTT